MERKMSKKIIKFSIIGMLILVSIVASYYFISIKNNAEIKYLKVIKENKPIILYFYDKNSIGCKLGTPIVKRAKYEYGDKINFILVNINNRDNFELVELYKIEDVPAYIVLNANKKISMSAPKGHFYFEEGYFKLFYDRFSENPNYIYQTGKKDWSKYKGIHEKYGDLIKPLP